MSVSRPRASVIVLTHNSAKTIKSVLDGIKKQEFTNFEVLIFDTASTDETLDIVKDYAYRIISVEPNDFGHGKTRNYAARLARGEFIIFLTHDSVPENSNWLSELVEPFSDKNVVGVYGRQIPRQNENILDKHFQMSLYGNTKIIWKSDNWHRGDNLFSDANSAVRKSVLLKNPYLDDIIVSEDYEWATRVLKLGFNIVYSPTASVIHSHSYTIHSLFKRNFDVGVSYKDIYTSGDSYAFVSKGLVLVKKEIKYLHQSGHTLLIPLAILRNIIRYFAIQLGEHEHLFTEKFKAERLTAQKWYWK